MNEISIWGKMDGLKKTEIGLLPESWKIAELGKIVDFKTGKLNSNAAEANGIYPFFTCSQETFSINKYAFDQEAILLSGNNARAIYSVKHYKQAVPKPKAIVQIKYNLSQL